MTGRTMKDGSGIPEIISDSAGLLQLCESLEGASAIGLDTEFMRERTYFAHLCLLQLSAGEHAVCVDTLALRDLTPLRASMSAPQTPKILHAARQDLEVLEPATGTLCGVFDTQVAAALIGMPAQVGYGDLVQQLLATNLRKAETRTDWTRRPLTSAQVAYALDDVRYLLPLRDRLRERLEALGRWSWFEEEMAELNASGPFAIDPQLAWRRLKGLSELDAARQDLGRKLAAWRERIAIDSDRPRNWILHDTALREIVMRVPRSPAELDAATELSDFSSGQHGVQILELIRSAQLPAQLPPLPQRRRPDPAINETVRKLAQITQQTGRELSMAPEILATRRDIERLVAGAREGGILSGWRRAVIGERLLKAL
jgi:ribonuclease D